MGSERIQFNDFLLHCQAVLWFIRVPTWSFFVFADMSKFISMHDPIIIVGGGFGGVSTAKSLLAHGQRVLLVSKSSHFTFTPLLHEVATGSLITHDIAFEYEGFFNSPAFEFVANEVTGVDPATKRLSLNGSELLYSSLVIATGSRTNQSLIEGMSCAFELKTVDDAIALKKAIIAKAQRLEKQVFVTVIGGGPTGCELVFDLQGLLLALKSRHPSLVSTIRLIHSKKEIGGNLRASMQRYIDKRLSESGIEVVRETYAKRITAHCVETSSGAYASDITVVVAGVQPNSDPFIASLPHDAQGHLLVDDALRLVGMSDIYALGDVIRMGDNRLPKLAQTAVAQADVVAQNILRGQRGQSLQHYRVHLKGFLLSLGYGDGVGEIFGVVVKGVVAWYIWRTIYLFKTPGLLNKLRVAFSWTLGLFKGRDLASL